jgi:hypothetical protein
MPEIPNKELRQIAYVYKSNLVDKSIRQGIFDKKWATRHILALEYYRVYGLAAMEFFIEDGTLKEIYLN